MRSVHTYIQKDTRDKETAEILSLSRRLYFEYSRSRLAKIKKKHTSSWSHSRIRNSLETQRYTKINGGGIQSAARIYRESEKCNPALPFCTLVVFVCVCVLCLVDAVALSLQTKGKVLLSSDRRRAVYRLQ